MKLIGALVGTAAFVGRLKGASALNAIADAALDREDAAPPSVLAATMQLIKNAVKTAKENDAAAAAGEAADAEGEDAALAEQAGRGREEDEAAGAAGRDESETGGPHPGPGVTESAGWYIWHGVGIGSNSGPGQPGLEVISGYGDGFGDGYGDDRSFYFYNRNINDEPAVEACIHSFSGGQGSLGGIMVRDSANMAFVGAMNLPVGMKLIADSQRSDYDTQLSIAPPYCVKLEKEGRTIRSFYRRVSNVDWILTSSRTNVPFNDNTLQVGIAVASGSGSADNPATLVYSDFSVRVPKP